MGIKASSGSASVEEQIKRPKLLWSLLADQSDDDEVAEESNVRVFQALQLHSTWGKFFVTFGYDTRASTRMGELTVGEKFAKGRQAELFHGQVTWSKECFSRYNNYDIEKGQEWVVKVFKKGTFLHHLQHQLLHGLLQYHSQQYIKPSMLQKRHPRSHCAVHNEILLEDGRFAFLMQKEHFDLCTLIERKMRLNSGEAYGPFLKEDVEIIMYKVALGVEWLHGRDIVHRDLKASNVLIREFESGWPKWVYFVADYECSVGVVGTSFFRAPKILQACKDWIVNRKQNVFTKAVDVYSYGMTCYEILTGKLPYEGHVINDYDIILKGKCPILPKYVEDWTRDLLYMCWESNPRSRLTIGEIVDILLANSKEAKALEKSNKKVYEYDF